MTPDQKLDKILEDLTEMKIVQAEHSLLHKQNTDDLATHIKRTNLLELKLESEMAPVKKHITKVETTGKISMYVLGIVGTVILALNELGILKKLL